MHPPARAYFSFPCPYEDCDGEFDLAEAIATMARDKEDSSKGKVMCPGHRNRGDSARAPCQLTLDYRVTAQKA
jgi:hypothetical protein